jgi:hypothetical protein
MSEPFPSDAGVYDDGAELSFEDMIDEAPPDSLRLVEPDVHDLDVEGLDDETIATLRAPRWEITDVAGADWAMRKIRKHRRSIASNATLARREIDRWTAWLEKENTQYVNDIERMSGMLRVWAAITTQRRLADVGGVWSKLKPKMLRAPSGKVDVKKSEAGRFNGGSADAQKIAVEMLRDHGYEESVHESKSYSVRPTELDALVEAGNARINADGWYEIQVISSEEPGDEHIAWARLPICREGRGQITYKVVIDGDEPAQADVDDETTEIDAYDAWNEGGAA